MNSGGKETEARERAELAWQGHPPTGGYGGLEGTLSRSLLSHQDVHVVAVVPSPR
uniref:Uncharacterized protein n=1 Tax=Anguilla anguilla TaxID=7936 RepID=A0A0E9UCP2_ANGAN